MIGSFGDIVFVTSEEKNLTPRGFKRAVSSRWATHEPISGKPRTQYTGAGLQSVSFEMQLMAEYGVKPRAMLDQLAEMCEGDKAYPLVIGGRPVGEHNWRLLSCSEEYNTVYNLGELASASVSVTLEEYV